MPRAGTLAGEPMPDGLSESARLDTPIFSPATKAESGHDENITVGRMREILGADVTAELERLTRVVYSKGRDVAAAHGIIIADTKFEFGRTKDGEIILIDEVMTPDSSRFWPADGYRRAGRSPASTSSRCATGSMSSAMPAAGTAMRRRRSCRPRSSRRPASAISKPIAA